MWRTTRGGLVDERDLDLSEIILVGGFLYFPAFLVVLTKLLHSGYVPRHGWPAILGLVLGSVYLVRAVWLRSASTYLLAALLIACVYQDGNEARMLYNLSRVDERWNSLVELSRNEPSIPVVFADPLAYVEAAEYSPRELRDQLVTVVDADIATRFLGTDSADKSVRLLAQFIALHVEDGIVSVCAWEVHFALGRPFRLVHTLSCPEGISHDAILKAPRRNTLHRRAIIVLRAPWFEEGEQRRKLIRLSWGG